MRLSLFVLLFVGGLGLAAPPSSLSLALTRNFGTTSDAIQFTAFDGAGNLYVAGTTARAIPLVGAVRTSLGPSNCSIVPGKVFEACSDIFLAKFDASGQRLIYSTYLGTDYPDEVKGLVVDRAGNAWVGGTSFEVGYARVVPIEGGTFVAKLDPNGGLVYQKRAVGGTNLVGGIAVDGQENVYVTGTSYRDDFQAVRALQPKPVVKSIYVTRDGGSSWAPMNEGIPGGVVYSMAIDPSAPALMYAATNRGLFQSRDAGANWRRIFPAAVIARQVVIGRQREVYVSYGGAGEDVVSLARSLDGGTNWSVISGGLPRQGSFSQPQVIGVFAVDPSNAATLWVLGVGFGAGGGV